MDAQAYLIRHGWSGPGNPLNPNQRPGPHGGLGLTKPILVARKQNNHGVGKKTTKDPTNQWWLRGFEDALKGIGEDKPTSTSSNNALTSELYRHFVRGEYLAGTIEQKTVEEPKEKSKSKSKRKRDSEDEDERRAKKEEKAARKEEKRKRRKLKEDLETAESATVSSSETSGSEKRKESKEERRLRKKEKKERKERKSEEKKLKKSKRSASDEDYPTPRSTDEDRDDGQMDIAESDEAPATTKEKKAKKESRKSKSNSKDKDSEGERKSDSKKPKKEKKAKKENFA
ncbi:uncharacterized protein N7458_006910 [Penicillium daleae]|uniref:G-patch domain-containing protein n=1 Tax=Penicillium daleae TaxID=63821 RepID=A0AAD6G3F4_9EURO|nr:uncharacterized protein N7458_006910 [Penicillium daleae]KAJ5450461.1 hypothetical protein N7458_006910 [Penicillium daleae]